MPVKTLGDYMDMFKGKDGSPSTQLTYPYKVGDTTLTVNDGTCLLPAPNLCTLYSSAGCNSGFAVIKYDCKNNNVLSSLTVQFVNRTDIVFPRTSLCSRRYTEYDQYAFINNIDALYSVTTGLIQYVHPISTIDKFEIFGLEHVVPLGYKFIGDKILTHKETLGQFMSCKDLALIEDGIEIARVPIENVETAVDFTANLSCCTVGSHDYELVGYDILGDELKMKYKVTVVYPIYYGHNADAVICTDHIYNLNLSDKCEDGMELTFTANNDYVWFCIAKPSSIKEVTSYGFTVPLETPVERTIVQSGISVDLLCYRVTEQVVSGIEHKFKLHLEIPNNGE